MHGGTYGVAPGRSLTPPEAIFFDLDGTLMDSSAVIAPAVAYACHQIALAEPGLNVERLVAANKEAFASYWPEAEEKWTLGFLDGATVSLEAWRRTLSVCGSDDETLVKLAFEAHTRHVRESYRLFDDVRGVLDLLKTQIPLALITNGAADTQWEKLQATSLTDHFKVTAISGEMAVAKPDSAIFDSVLDKLNINPGNVWHIGDSLNFDVAGANAAGLKSVWLNRAGRLREPQEPQPDMEIALMTELLAFL